MSRLCRSRQEAVPLSDSDNDSGALPDASSRPGPRASLTSRDRICHYPPDALAHLRGQEILPDLLGIVGKETDLRPYASLLRAWLDGGSHRLDRDGNGRYDDEAAVALMDAWWNPLVHAMFDSQLNGLYDLVGVNFHDAPSGHLGSAFQGSYYGAVQKALRQASRRRLKARYQVLRGGGKPKACFAAVQASLREAVATLTDRFSSSDPATWTVDPTDDEIRFSLGGIAGASPIPWQNRSTFQQVVQIREP